MFSSGHYLCANGRGAGWLRLYGTLHGKGNDNSVSRLMAFRKSPILSVTFWQLSGGHHDKLTGNGYHLTVSGFAPSHVP